MRLAVLCLLVCAPAATAQSRAATVAEARQADLTALRAGLLATHPNPFAGYPAARWDSAASALGARAARLRPAQWLVELQRLVALLGDAHTVISPLQPALPTGVYPFELYSFEDGLFVIRAGPPHTGLAGARVLRIGTMSAGDAVAAVGTTVSHENEFWLRAWAPRWLSLPGMLDGLGIAADPDRLTLVVERGGRTDTVVVSPGGPAAAPGHRPGFPADQSGWADMRQAEAPLWQRRPGEWLWHQYLPESRALYVSYRAIVSPPHGPSSAARWKEVFTAVDSLAPERLILDIRDNLGGNGFLNRNVVRPILRREALDRPERLFVIIGRQTFSAAQQLANQLEWWTAATLVGEPTGQRPSSYGDHREVVLPGSGIVAMVSTLYHQGPNPLDRRSFVPPHLFTPLTSAQYRQGVDPALAAALAGQPPVSLGAEVERLLRAGDTAAARRAVGNAATELSRRYRPVEPELNAAGYRLLAAGEAALAIAILRLTTEAFPHSANAFDSLGEALARAGRREEAVAAYRRALAIDPGFGPSQAGLHRLTSPP